MSPKEAIIEVQNVSKVFSLHTKSISLRQEALSFFSSRKQRNAQTEEFYALREISFKIRRGESVAIIGRNGSGKTTLLRILSNILKPTHGQVKVDGMFTTLIGLGAGFVETMTGYENIFLNSAMFGNKPKETEAVLDEIIEFADIDKFINVPVKDYSSGMRARLGFSIAIHILADIVFIDEILTVGDATFKKKCNQKLQALRKENRTFIIVSHSKIKNLCERAIWLHHGQLMEDGPIADVWAAYQDFKG